MNRACLGLLVWIVAGCGAEVAVGTLADGNLKVPSDAAATPDGSPAASSSSPTKPAANCASVAAPEILVEGKDTGDARIIDFHGDSERLIASMNVIANFKAGTVLELPNPAPGQSLFDASPDRVGAIGIAKDRVFVAVETVAGMGRLVAAPRTGGLEAAVDLPTVPPIVATFPSRAAAFYLAPGSGAPNLNVVNVWDPPKNPNVALVFPETHRVRAVATNASTVVALAEDTSGTSLQPSFVLARPNTMAGGGPYFTLATIDGNVLPTIAVDEQYVYGAAFHGAAEIWIYRVALEQPQGAFTDESAVGRIPASSALGVRLEVDETHVYVSTMTLRECASCLPDVEIGRVPKEGSATAPSKAEIVVRTTGEPTQSGLERLYNVDGCFLYWPDPTRQALRRQSKSTLTNL